MDRQTRELRRRNKAQANKRGAMSDSTPFGYGRKGRVERFPLKQCSYVVGGKKTLIFKRRDDGTTYAIPLIKGGHRCPQTALGKGRCLNHLGVEQ